MSILKDILDAVFGQPNPASGHSGLGINVTVPLSSGYNSDLDQAAAVDRLTQLQREAIALFPADALPGGHWKTKCNFGLMHVADGLSCRDLDGLNATCIVRHVTQLCLQPGNGWREGDEAQAAEHALKGGLGFGGIEAPPGEAHGHVASVAAEEMKQSPSWHVLEPTLCNVGKPPNDFKLASACFLESERPTIRWFIWEPA